MRIVFDLDGTLIDSIQDLADAANAMVRGYGGAPLAVGAITEMVGEGASVLVRRVLAAAGLTADPDEALQRFLDLYDRDLLAHTRPYAGIPEVLAGASRAHRLALLTNKPVGASTRILDALGLHAFFDRVVGGDGPYPRKPDPAGLRALLADAPGMPAALVGDSPVDEQTARAAGCHFVYARYGFGSRRYGASLPDTPFIADEPGDLLRIFAEIERTPSRQA